MRGPCAARRGKHVMPVRSVNKDLFLVPCNMSLVALGKLDGSSITVDRTDDSTEEFTIDTLLFIHIVGSL